ncbi:MAG: ABC transporter ATP-binding protein [Spirochaetales bacterium]|nr:ABC transporter ATP-binding protein [Spirochaetales bacterium]
MRKYKEKILQLLILIGKSKWVYIGALTAIAGEVAAESVGNLVIRHIIDKVILENRGMAMIILFTFLFGGISLFRAVFSFLEGRGKAKVSETVAKNIRNQMYDHIQHLSFQYHDKAQTGELVQRATSDVDAVRRFFAEQVPGIARIGLLFIINFIILIVLDTKLALLSIIAVPLITFSSLFFFRLIFKAYDDFQDHQGKMTARIQENLSGIRVVRAFARQDWDKDRFRKVNSTQRQKGMTLLISHALYWPLAHTICGLQFVLTILVGAIMVINGTMTPGTFVAFSSMVNALIWPLQELGRMITELSKSFVSFNRISEILNTEREDLHTGDIRGNEKIIGKIEIRNLAFAYNKDIPVLRNISLKCKPGETIALVGATGSGKTTLVNLLLRNYDYQEGGILLDGRPLDNYSRHFLRRNIGIVEQEPFLFSTTIRENISYSLEKEVSLDEIISAAKVAAIHDSIMAFPDGYDTMVGEKGVSLSGGQKQRITIARTILKNPAILILDDSTSAVDAATEEKIKTALEKLMAGRTNFIIAHRIQTLKMADRILVMKDGEIVQEGTHRELVETDGFYKQVFTLQTEIEEDLQKELAEAALKEEQSGILL